MKSWNTAFLASSAIILILFFLSSGVGVGDKGNSSEEHIACNPASLTGEIDFSDKRYVFDGKENSVPQLAYEDVKPNVLGTTNANRWIEVDLSEQTLIAWEGNQVYLQTPISTGLPWWPTPQGEFRIWIKLRATKMEGGEGRYYYYLPNVPYVMFFENESFPGWRGYGLHGTYWHDDFGTQRSHGCVNLPTDIAGLLYNWTDPLISDGKWVVYSSAENPGTRIVIHE